VLFRAEGGTLLYGAGITTDLSGRIKNSGSVITIDSGANAITYASAIDSSNVGGLSKAGSGTLTLAASNGFGGGATLNAGTLAISNNAALGTGALTFASNSTTLDALLNNMVITNAQTLTGNGTYNVGSSLNFTNAGVIGGAGSFTKTGAGTMTLSLGGTNANAATVNGGTLVYNNTSASTLGLNSSVTIGNGATVQFSRTGSSSQVNLGSATPFTFTAAGGGVLDNSAGVNLVLNTATSTITSSGGARNQITGTNGININNKTFILDVARGSDPSIDLLVSGRLWNGGTLVKAGTGIVALTFANTNAFNTMLNAGTLAISNNAALGQGALTFASNNTTLDALLNNMAITNAQTLTGNGTYNVGNGLNFTNAGVIGGAGSLAKTGAGTMTLSGTNTFGGDITITAGALQIGGSGRLGSGNYAGAITNSASLIFNSSANQTLAGVISGSGSLTRSGTGVLTLSSSNSYGGATIITNTSGGIIASASGALSSGSVTMNSGTALGLTNSVRLNNDAYITGGGAGTAGGNGFNQGSRGYIQSLGGTNTYGGNIYVVGTGTTRVAGLQDGGSLNITGSIISTNATVFFRASGSSGDYITLSGAGNAWTQDLNLFGTTTNGGLRLGLNNALATNAGVTSLLGSAVNIDLNGFNQTLRSLVGSSGSLIIDNRASGTSTLTLDSSNTNVTSSAGTVLADGISGGKVALVKNGSGTQTLQGASTYSGGTTLNNGSLVLGNANALGTGDLTVNGGTLNLNGFNLTQASLTLTGGTLGTNGSTQTLTASTYDLNGGTVNANLGGGTVNVGGDTVLNGTASDTTVNIVSGMLTLGGANRLNSAATVAVAGILNLGGNNQTLAGLTGSGAVTNGNGGTLTLDIASGTNTFGGSLQGAGALNKTGSGILDLTGANSYSGGTAINAGAVSSSSENALGSGDVTLADSTLFRYTGAGATMANNFSVGGGTGIIQNTGGGLLTLSGTLTKQGSVLQFAGGSYNVTGKITGNTVSFNSDLLLSNAAVTLSGANNDYFGPTYVTAGSTLTAGINNALPTNTVVYLGGSADSSSVTNSLNLAGYDATIGGLASLGNGYGRIINGGGTASTLTLNGATTSTFGGAIGGAGGNAINLVVSGGQTLNLTGANSYTGTTTIQAGSSINLGSTGSLSGTSAVNLNGGTLLLGGNNQVNTSADLNLNGGTLSMGGNGSTRASAQTFDTLTLTANSVIDFAALTGTSSLTFSSIAGLGSYTLSIWNWTADTTRLYDSSGNGLSSGNLANISFYSGAGSGFLGTGSFSSFNNEIVPVPEPGVVISALLLLGWLLYSFRMPILARIRARN